MAAVDGPFDCDLSRFPIAIWRVHRPLNVKELRLVTDDMLAVLARRVPHVQIMSSIEVKGHSALPPEGRMIQAQWVKEHFDELSRYCLGMGIAANMSPVLHFAASMVMSVMGKSPMPWKLFGSEQEAIKWAEGRLSSRRAL